MDVDKKFLEGLQSVKLLDEELKIVYGFLDEMARFSRPETGLDYVVWMGEVGGQHGPRIKVSNNKGKMTPTDSFVVSLSKNPSVLTPRTCKLPTSTVEDILDWIRLNYETLMEMWEVFEGRKEESISLLIGRLKQI